MTRKPRLASALLWMSALVLMLGSYEYQKLTGPTYPYRDTIVVDGTRHPCRLLRSQETTNDAVIAVPSPGDKVTGQLFWRRYPTEEPFTAVPLQPGNDGGPIARAALPKQPSAGKLEYHLELVTPAGPQRIPADPAEEIVLRFKDPVPASALVPHIAMMFLSMMVGLRAVLSALFQVQTMRRYAWTALAGLFVGGLILGPFVQKHAFGAYWTGWPYGYDLTDNKSLLMWLCWLVACAVLLLAPKRVGLGRTTVVLAGVVMVVVYLIPHSMRGSQLDYGKLQGGVEAKEAIGTGR